MTTTVADARDVAHGMAMAAADFLQTAGGRRLRASSCPCLVNFDTLRSPAPASASLAVSDRLSERWITDGESVDVEPLSLGLCRCVSGRLPLPLMRYPALPTASPVVFNGIVIRLPVIADLR